MKPLYEAIVTSQGGRSGHVKSSDGFIDLPVALPPALGGPGGATNPEQLFAAGYAACFESAVGHVAKLKKLNVTGTRVIANVAIGQKEGGGFQLAAKLVVGIRGIDKSGALGLIEESHRICPYSNATRGNIRVDLEYDEQFAAE